MTAAYLVGILKLEASGLRTEWIRELSMELSMQLKLLATTALLTIMEVMVLSL